MLLLPPVLSVFPIKNMKFFSLFTKTPFVWHPADLSGFQNFPNFGPMFIKSVKKWRKDEKGEFMTPYRYHRLCESYRDANGKTQQRMLLGLGELIGFSTDNLKELAGLLTEMIDHDECRLCEDARIYEKALEFYQLYKDTKRQEASQAALQSKLSLEAQQLADARKRDLVTVNLKSLHATDVRQVGAEHVCRSTLSTLRLKEFLLSKGFSRQQTDIALLQIIARAVYPYSELKTVSYLQENSALCEMFGIDPSDITKDLLYQSASKLYSVHRDLENWLHRRVCSLFNRVNVN